MPTTAAPEAARIWAPEVETLDRRSLGELQLERLRTTVRRVLAAQPRGAELLAEAGIAAAEDVRSLEDLQAIPFMTKADLRANYPFGLFTVAREEIVRIHASSGTHGKPTVVGYTRNDLDNWTDLMARCMTTAGVRPGMLVHNANGYGLFTGGFGFHQGAERLGATIAPVSGGFTARQVMMLHDLGGDVLVSTPSYALTIAAAIREAGVDPATLPLKLGLFGGEPWTEQMRDRLDRELCFQAINFFGLSEMCGPGVAVECVEQRHGLHVNEDHFLTEVIDPEDGRVLAPGAEGELVFTTLTKEALPLIRYRTGDIGRLTTEPCACGRTTARLEGLCGRIDDMVVIRGVNVYPSNVEHLLLSVEGIAPHYRLTVERPDVLDELTLECEAAGEAGEDARQALAEQIVARLREHMGLRITVLVHGAGSLPRSEGKAIRLIDRRPKP
jgi:phenylacetate-CoA ligase